MEKLLPLFVALGLCAVPTPSDAQQVKPMLSKAKTTTNASVDPASSEAYYAMPAVLSNIGTHSSDNIPVCNYLTRHKSINGGAFLWAPFETPVKYIDQSSGAPTAWMWSIPGAAETTQATQNAEARYLYEGIFDMPTLTVTTANGQSSYTPSMSMTSAGGNEQVKVGGTAEITAADMRVSAQLYDPNTSTCFPANATYALGAMGYESNGGYVGGSNNRGITGWGNFYMVGHDELELTGVNVYFHHKPTKYAAEAKVTLNVWVPLITETNIYFTQNPNTGGYPIESAFIKYSDIKADGEDGAWALTYDGAVANITFPTPIDLYGKPYIFISIDGFSQDPANDDLCLLTDLKGKALNDFEKANLLSHNSFGRMSGESDYLRPISSYGGGNGSFMICPVIRSYHTSSVIDGVDDIAAGSSDEFNAYTDGTDLRIESAADGLVSICDLTGKIVKQQYVAAGSDNIAIDALSSGFFIVKGPRGKAVKIIK